MKKNLLIFALSLCIFSCKKDDSIDTQLLGTWSDYNSSYTFNSDFTYNIRYLSTGSGPDSVVVDSAFGTYELDNKRVNVTFNQQGYRDKASTTVFYQSANPATWHYTIQNDTILNYTSHTTLGVLYKQ
jgi:hypothetical protein